MVDFDTLQAPHRRYNPIIQEFVLCSPHRTLRPWQGQQEAPQVERLPEYDPKCYLCPGNERAGGARNEAYSSTFVFENDYAAVKEDAAEFSAIDRGLFRVEPARGKCYVICFNPNHSLTLAELSKSQVVPIVRAWQQLYRKVSTDYPWIKYIQMVLQWDALTLTHTVRLGPLVTSLPLRPEDFDHSQNTLQSQLKLLKPPSCAHVEVCQVEISLLARTNGKSSLLLDYAYQELHPAPSSRVVFSTAHFVALTPFWATWPFEVMLLPHHRHIPSIADLTEEEAEDLADCLRRVTCRLDNIFQCSFPYSMGIYQKPVASDDENGQYAQLYFSWYPPLLRSASVRKFLVGFELFAEAQRDLTPETGAARIRGSAEEHYKHST